MLLAEDRSKRSIQLRIHECGFHHALAIIEGAAHREALDVLTPAGELLFLGRGHQALGKQHRHLAAGLAVEGRRDGAAGIPGGGDQDVERPLPGSAQACHARRQKARAKILEGRRRAMKELEHAKAPVRGKRHPGRGKIEGLRQDPGQLSLKFAVAQQRREQQCADPGQARGGQILIRRHADPRAQRCRLMQRPLLRHVQAPIRRQSFEQGLREARRGGAGGGILARASEQHGSQGPTMRAPGELISVIHSSMGSWWRPNSVRMAASTAAA